MKINEDILCSTGCQNPSHMTICIRCGIKYHFGTVHNCPTGHY